MLKVLFNNKKLALDAVMEELDGHFLKTVIIPYILRKHNSLLEIGMDMVVNVSISQKSYQTVVRNKIGATLKDIFGYNIFPTTEDLFSKINNTKDILQNAVELQFSEPNYCSTIAGFVNVKKSLERLLSKKVFDGLVNPERKQIVVYSYTDAFPWMQWSQFFSGESAIRLRIVNVSNTLSSIITVGSWLGPDDFEHVASLGTSIYKQLTSLKSVCFRGQEVGINVWGLADGSQRRISSGASTARSSYPIEEAPEHLTQLGDMLIFCDEPVWNTENTQNIESDYKKWLKNKKKIM